MAGSLHKTRKQISKKRNGAVTALHEKSRDSLRLHRASVRDQRLEKLAAARGKKEQPIAERVAYFQEALLERDSPDMDLETVQQLVHDFVHQYDAEYAEAKKTRRAGRPASTKEDMLKIKISALENERKQGFYLPDIMSPEAAKQLIQWEGSWSYLTTIPWVKLHADGNIRPADFPSKGLN